MSDARLSVIPIAVVFMIAWAISRGIKRYANKYPPVSADDTAGVGGWLLFLIVGFMFLGPVMSGGRLSSEFMLAESQYANLKESADWNLLKDSTWWTFWVFSCLSVYGGNCLAEGRDISAVRRAKILLWIVGPVAGLFSGLALPALIFGRIAYDSEAVGALIGGLITSVIGAAIWTAYLSKSKRVRATYGNPSSLGTDPIIPPKAAL